MKDPWTPLQRCLLIGLDRSSLPEGFRQYLKTQGIKAQDSEAQAAMAGLSFYHFLKKGASQTPQLTQAPAKAPNENGQTPNPQLSRIVERMLLKAELEPVLSEYIQYSAGVEITLPNEALPAVFELHKEQPDQIILIREIMGVRGEWLARQNPEWAIYTSFSDYETWQYGALTERCQYLDKLRLSEPAKARELLEETWPKESVAQQLALLRSLLIRTSLEDVPFLEKCLAVNELSIRILAAKLLMTLPQSDYRKRVISAAKQWIKYSTTDGFYLDLTLNLKPLAQKIGFITDSQQKALNKQQKKQLLTFIIRLLPPETFEEIAQQKTKQCILSLQQAAFYFVNQAALAESIYLHQDQKWMLLFIQSLLDKDRSQWEAPPIQRLLRYLPYAVFAELCLQHLKFHNNILDGSGLVYFLLMETEHHWPKEVTLRIVQVFQDYLQYQQSFLQDDAHHYIELLEQLALKSDTSLLINIQVNWPQGSFSWYQWEAHVQKMLRILHFRAKMIQAFDSPL